MLLLLIHWLSDLLGGFSLSQIPPDLRYLIPLWKICSIYVSETMLIPQYLNAEQCFG